MKQALKKVREFHKTYGCFTADKLGLPLPVTHEVRELRRKLFDEECQELYDAEMNNDIVEIADALADIVYIVAGTALAYGIPLDKVFDEVHASNMSKLGEDGKPLIREDGKVEKGPNYFAPRLRELLAKTAGWYRMPTDIHPHSPQEGATETNVRSLTVGDRVSWSGDGVFDWNCVGRKPSAPDDGRTGRVMLHPDPEEPFLWVAAD